MNNVVVAKSISFPKVLCMFVLLLMFVLPAVADYEVWFPYAGTFMNERCDSSVQSTDVAPMGPYGNAVYDNIHGTEGENIIWNEDVVYYEGESGDNYSSVFASNEDGRFEWYLEVHNPATSGTIQCDIYFYSPGGSVVHEDTEWGEKWYISGTEEGETYDILDTTGSTNLSWNTTNNCFELDVDAGETEVVACWDYSQVFLRNPGKCKPEGEEEETAFNLFYPSICIRSTNIFEAAIKGSSLGRYRIDESLQTSSYSTNRSAQFNSSYNGIDVTQYEGEGEGNTITLPYYQDRFLTSQGSDLFGGWHGLDSRTYPDSFTYCCLTNASNSSEEYLIEVFDLDGNPVPDPDVEGEETDYPAYSKTLNAHETFFFMPSQFYEGTYNPLTDFEGIIKITGTKPVAVAVQGRCSKATTGVTSGEKFRIPTTQVRPFVLE